MKKIIVAISCIATMPLYAQDALSVVSQDVAQFSSQRISPSTIAAVHWTPQQLQCTFHSVETLATCLSLEVRQPTTLRGYQTLMLMPKMRRHAQRSTNSFLNRRLTTPIAEDNFSGTLRTLNQTVLNAYMIQVETGIANSWREQEYLKYIAKSKPEAARLVSWMQTRSRAAEKVNGGMPWLPSDGWELLLDKVQRQADQ